MPGRSWLIRIAPAPGEPASREMLERVLAAASLDIAVAVVFEGEGLRHLEPEWFEPWRQLVDFELAALHALDPPAGLLPGGVAAIDEQALARLCSAAAGELAL